MTSTRTDEDLQIYYLALQNKDYIDEEDIQRLLDAYRVKFDVDFVYMGEMQSNLTDILFTHASFSKEQYDLSGKTRRFRTGILDNIKERYDQDGLSDHSLDCTDKNDLTSILHYGLFHEQEYDGNIGMISFSGKRVWTDEERLAVRKLGRALQYILYMERANRITAVEQKKLEQQNHVMEAILSNTDCGLMRHSVDGRRILSINKAALKILGYKDKADLIADGFDLIATSVLDEDKPKLRKAIQQLKNIGDTALVEYRILHKDNTLLHITGNIKLLEEDGEKFYQRFLFDRTAQKTLEEQEQQEERHRQAQMIQALSVDYGSVFFVDLDTGMALPLRISDALMQRYGSALVGQFPFQSGLERYVQDLVYEPDKESLLQAVSVEQLTRHMSEKESWHTNYRIMRDGKLEYFQMKAARAGAWKNTHRIVIGLRSVDDEIRHEMTQKKLVEDSYEVIASLSSDYNFISLIDTENGHMSAYKAALNLPEAFALADTENYNDAIQAYSQYVNEEDMEMWLTSTRLEYILEQLRNKKIFYINIRNNYHEKTEYVQFSYTKVSRPEKKDQLVLAKRIITEMIEEEIRQRTLVENALAQAERANRAKSTFLSNMSHDIRTPMNAILGFTTLASSHIDQKERVQEYLRKIMSSGNHLLNLINDVLDMSRIESGKVHIEETPCSLPQIMHELCNILQADISAKHLEFYIDAMNVTNEEVFCDRLRLNQIFLNLLGNAVKFTESGGTIRMLITEKPCSEDDHARYVFHIKDTGIGMSKEFITHIFEPFERERSSTISKIQGTGLGMAITKNLVDMMNGTIHVDSEQGKGTEFTLSLTFRLQHSEKQPKDIPKLKGCRALVVDRDFNACSSISGMLQQLGIRSEWTLSGPEAVSRTRQARERGDEYDVYVINWLMPDMSGMNVAKEIRSKALKHTPIIILTAYDWSDIENDTKEADITALCRKPLFLSELQNCLRSIVEPEDTKTFEALPVSGGHCSGRILLTDDNELNREIAVELLSEAGFEVETAENGQVAVEMLSNSSPGYYHLILMDVQMPVMNGYDATRAIRKLKNKEFSSIPILAMTANAFKEDQIAALECGMNGHLSKPIDVDHMLKMMKKVLEDQNRQEKS